jgi:aryl carrier-like protein
MGMAARSEVGERLAEQGWGSIEPADGVALLPRLLEAQEGGAEIAVMPFELASWEQAHAPVKKLKLFESLRLSAGASSEAEPSQLRILDRLKEAAEATAREELMTAHLRERVAGVIKLSKEKIDVGAKLISLGFDSLMSIELRNKLESDLGMSVPVSSLLRGPTLRELAGLLLQKLAKVAPPSEAPAPVAAAAPVAPESPRPAARPTIPVLPRARRGVSNG